LLVTYGVYARIERERREREKIVHLVKRLISGVNLSFYFHVVLIELYKKLNFCPSFD